MECSGRRRPPLPDRAVRYAAAGRLAHGVGRGGGGGHARSRGARSGRRGRPPQPADGARGTSTNGARLKQARPRRRAGPGAPDADFSRRAAAGAVDLDRAGRARVSHRACVCHRSIREAVKKLWDLTMNHKFKIFILTPGPHTRRITQPQVQILHIRRRILTPGRQIHTQIRYICVRQYTATQSGLSSESQAQEARGDQHRDRAAYQIPRATRTRSESSHFRR